ncbi:MAG: zf-HC2 domain-containing protein [Gammaproteobacteria bacterium]
MKINSSISSNFNDGNNHDKIWNLLPWFINNTLKCNERTQVEQHVLKCSACQNELQEQRYLQNKLLENDKLPSQKINAFENVMSRIESDINDSKQSETKSGKIIPISNILQKIKKYKRYSIPSSIAATLLLTVTLSFMLSVSDKEKLFTTLTDSPTEYPTGNNSNELSNFSITKSLYLTRIIFKTNISTTKIKAVLNHFQGELVKGPDARNIYIFDFSKTINTAQQYQNLLARLQQHSSTLLVSAIVKPKLNPIK